MREVPLYSPGTKSAQFSEASHGSGQRGNLPLFLIRPRLVTVRCRATWHGIAGLVFKAHRLCVSLNSRLESNKEEEASQSQVRILDPIFHFQGESC